jgi:PhzF family phenazine biosynthesis protein
MAASYDFVQLDVFTRRPLAGNPLAIFTDARGLTDKQMQALAREMNLSETTFILPREPELDNYSKKTSHLLIIRDSRSSAIAHESRGSSQT